MAPSIKSTDMQDLLERLFEEHCVPNHIRFDNGPEMTAEELRRAPRQDVPSFVFEYSTLRLEYEAMRALLARVAAVAATRGVRRPPPPSPTLRNVDAPGRRCAIWRRL